MRFLSPLVGARKIDSGTVVISKERFKSLVIRASAEGLEKLDITPANHFPHYGRKAPARLIEYAYKAPLPFKITTVVTPSGKFLPIEDQLRMAESALRQRFQGVAAVK